MIFLVRVAMRASRFEKRFVVRQFISEIKYFMPLSHLAASLFPAHKISDHNFWIAG